MGPVITRPREQRTGLIHTGAAGMAVIGAAGTTIAVVEAVVIADAITGDAAVMMGGAAIADRVAA